MKVLSYNVRNFTLKLRLKGKKGRLLPKPVDLQRHKLPEER